MLDHPYVIKYIESYEDDRYMYLIMECVQNGDLFEYITKRYDDGMPLKETEVKAIMKMLLQGISHIHSNGVVHRDIKPDNVLINDKGEVKIIDFGLSKVRPKDACACVCFYVTSCSSFKC